MTTIFELGLKLIAPKRHPRVGKTPAPRPPHGPGVVTPGNATLTTPPPPSAADGAFNKELFAAWQS